MPTPICNRNPVALALAGECWIHLVVVAVDWGQFVGFADFDGQQLKK
jgi:hypothetical protein